MAAIKSAAPANLIKGSDEAESFNNSLEGATILALGGDDKITNSGASAVIDAGDGDDYLYNTGKGVSLSGGDGNERVVSYGSNSTINTGAGNDSVMSYIASVTTSAGDGNDTITVFGRYAGGSGNTIIGGTGDDTIDNKAANVLFLYQEGDGNDLIQGFKDTSTLRVEGTASTQESGDNVNVSVGSNVITLEGAATLSTINIETITQGVTLDNYTGSTLITGTGYADSIINHANYVTIQARGSDDTIINFGDTPSVTTSFHGRYALIQGDAGKDSLENHSKYVTLDGGADDDTLGNSSWGVEASLNGGDGNDYFWNHAKATIEGGAGDDTVYNGSGSEVIIKILQSTAAREMIHFGTTATQTAFWQMAAQVTISFSVSPINPHFWEATMMIQS